MNQPSRKLKLATLLSLALAAGSALADITVGISLPTTGPGAALGIPIKNSLEFWPDKIGGEKLKVVLLDDGSDPTHAVQNARKFATEDKADVIVGSALTPTALAISQITGELATPQLAMAPVELPADKQKWVFRLPQPISLMAAALLEDMKARKIKTLGFIGYSDPWGEVWLKEITPGLEAAGIKLVATERYARADTSVTGQALKILAAKPDAVLVAGSGAGSALPQTTLVEKGYKGQFYQTHAAANRDVLRVGGAAMEGSILPVGPVLVAEQLPDSHPSKKVGVNYVKQYEGKYGPGSRTTFGAHAADALALLQHAVPVALKKAKPGTPEFRAALRDALETEKDMVAANGVYNYSVTDHFGTDKRARVLVQVEKGDFKLMK